MTKDDVKRFIISSDYSVILTHQDPDEDAVGASLAIQYILSEIYNIKTHVIFPNAPNLTINTLSYLENNNNVFYMKEDNITERELYEILLSADRIYFVDISTRERFPEYKRLIDYLEKSCDYNKDIECNILGATISILRDKIIHIDHRHIFDMPIELQYAKVKFIDPQASSTCEVISKYFLETIIPKEQIPKDLALLLLFGIFGDTNFLTKSDMNESTFTEISKLMTYGKITYDEVIDITYRNKNKNVILFENEILSKYTKFIPSKKTVFFYIQRSTADYYKVKNGLNYIMQELLRMRDYDFFVGLEEKENGVHIWIRGYDFQKIKKASEILDYKGHKRVASKFIPNKDIKQVFVEYVKKIIN